MRYTMMRTAMMRSTMMRSQAKRSAISVMEGSRSRVCDWACSYNTMMLAMPMLDRTIRIWLVWGIVAITMVSISIFIDMAVPTIKYNVDFMGAIASDS